MPTLTFREADGNMRRVNLTTSDLDNLNSPPSTVRRFMGKWSSFRRKETLQEPQMNKKNSFWKRSRRVHCSCCNTQLPKEIRSTLVTGDKHLVGIHCADCNEDVYCMECCLECGEFCSGCRKFHCQECSIDFVVMSGNDNDCDNTMKLLYCSVDCANDRQSPSPPTTSTRVSYDKGLLEMQDHEEEELDAICTWCDNNDDSDDHADCDAYSCDDDDDFDD